MPDDSDDFEAAWARIVADLTSDPEQDVPAEDVPAGDDHAAPPAPPAADPQAGLAALFEPLRRAQADRGRESAGQHDDAGDRDATAGRDATPERATTAGGDADPGAFVDNWEDEGHFVPPPPPEIPEGTPLKRLAWAGLLGGPATLALIVLTGFDAPRLISVGAGLVTLAGFVTLVWLMPDSREDSGWDDGARL